MRIDWESTDPTLFGIVDPTLLGEIVLDEIAAREWSIDYFVETTGVSVDDWADMFTGKAPVTDVMCLTLSLTFGTSSTLWENLRHAKRID